MQELFASGESFNNCQKDTDMNRLIHDELAGKAVFYLFSFISKLKLSQSEHCLICLNLNLNSQSEQSILCLNLN